MEEFDLDELIERCNQGEFENIAKGGIAKCYDIDDKHVLVIATNTRYENSKKVSDIIKGIDKKRIPNVHTVLECKTDGKKSYELQSKAKGEYFKKKSTKQEIRTALDRCIARKAKFIEMGRTIQVIGEENNIAKWKKQMQTPEYASQIDTRKEELMRRYSLIMQMPIEHLTQYFDTILTLSDYGIEIDTSGSNVLYDSETGFNFIDLMRSFNGKKVSFDGILNSYSSDTMTELLGTDKINEVPEEERPECLEAMRDALKKVVISVFDLEHGSQKMSKEIIEKSLATYKKYRIDLTYEEIVQEMQKEAGTQQLGRETVSVQSETTYIDETSQTMEEQRRLIEQQQANDRPSI